MATNDTNVANKRALLLVPALLLAVLPGCFTGNLWDIGRNGAYEKTGERHIQQVVDARLTDGDIPTWHLAVPSSDPDRATSHLCMWPRNKAREAVALMQRPELFTLTSNSIDAACTVNSGAPMGGKATLDLTGRILSSGWRSDIDEQQLPGLVRTRLHDAMTDKLPQALRECGERLSTADIELLFPEAQPLARITGYVFVDHSNTPLPRPTDPAPKPDGAPSYCHLRAQLQACTLYAKLQDGDRERILRIDPDAFWLLSTLRSHQGIAAHASDWYVDLSIGDSSQKQQACLRKQLNLSAVVQTFEKPQPSAGVKVVQVVLTPPALIADLVITVPLILILTATGALDDVH